MGCKWDELCLETIDHTWWGVLIEIVVFLYTFLGLAKVADDWMCTSLETLCVKWNVREDVAGASFLALGSAAPEIVINLIVVLKSLGRDSNLADLGVASIIGSGMIAFLLIPGVIGLSAGQKLSLKRRPLFRDIVIYAISLVLLCIFFNDGTIDLIEGSILVGVYVIYLLILIFAPSVRLHYRSKKLGLAKPLLKKKSFVLAADVNDRDLDDFSEDGGGDFEDGTDIEGNKVEETDEDDEPQTAIGKVMNALGKPFDFMFEWTMPNVELDSKYESWYLFTFVVSFLWVAVFSFIISSCVTRWVELSGMSMAFLGMTLIALGAQVPDTISSVTVARKIVNILIGLGLPWFVVGCFGANVSIHDHDRLLLSAYFMFGCTFLPMVLLLGHALVTGANKAQLTKGKGVVLLLAYPATVAAYAVATYLLYGVV